MRLLVALLACSGCADERIFEISDTHHTLAEVMAGAEDWSTTGGSLGLTPLGSNQFPLAVTLRLRIYELCGDNDECDFDMTFASIAAVAGSPCTVTMAPSCSAKLCYGELQITALGNCLLAVHANASDNNATQTCWYRAVYEAADPYDQALFAMYTDQTDGEVARCRDAL